MATFYEPSGCLTSSWSKAADNGKFQFRADSKSTIMELLREGGDYVDDNFSDDPFTERLDFTSWSDVETTLTWTGAGIKVLGVSGTDPLCCAYYVDVPNVADVDIYFDLMLDTGSYRVGAGVMARADLTNATFYCFGIRWWSDPYNRLLSITKWVNGTQYNLAAGLSIPFDTWYRCRAQVIGTDLKFKYWLLGEDEPDAWNLETDDDTIASGRIGLYAKSRNNAAYYAFLDNFYAYGGEYPSDSPLRYCEWDSGNNLTEWADTLIVKSNVSAADSGTVKLRVGYSNTQPSTLSEGDCDALLGDLKTIEQAAAGGMGGTGRWRVIAYQFDSDGAQQASLAVFDEAQSATQADEQSYVVLKPPTPVNHDTGGADTLTYKTSGGAGICGADVRAYVKKDYDEGRTSGKYIRGQTTTDSNGRWITPMFLDAAHYKIVACKPGHFDCATVDATVSAIGQLSSGNGSVEVDHNTGGADNLRMLNEDGQGVDNCDLFFYLSSDYNAGNISDSYVKALTKTRYDGRHIVPANLDPGDYTLCVVEQTRFKTVTKEFTVS